ncbi:polygalacturonase, partial [Penicillium daleae]
DAWYGSDDAPDIRRAFDKCGTDGNVIFENTTYHVNSVLNTTNLFNCQVDIYGTLRVRFGEWSNDTSYWLNHSMPTGYQNMSTVWFLGGRYVNVQGHGYGTFNGNGQAWYDLVKGQSNYPGTQCQDQGWHVLADLYLDRPMVLTIWDTKDSVFEGIRFLQAQMWTVTIRYLERVMLQDIYVNNTSGNKNPARNTDGANRLFPINGDDCIAMKVNSTNILIEDATFHNGEGIALGSIGQYKGQFETIENITVRNVVCNNTKYATRVKTWTGDQVGYPPNGGGGGLGYCSNFTTAGITTTPILFSQCTTYNGVTGNCSSSLFKISDFSATHYRGTSELHRQAPVQ